MSALLDSLAAAAQGDPARAAALEAILRDGLPGARTEAWKYTPLRVLERRAFAPAPMQAPAFDPAVIAGIPGPRLVFVNGRFDATASDLAGVPEGMVVAAHGGHGPGNVVEPQLARPEHVFARLNHALAEGGFDIRVPAGMQVPVPLHLVFAGAPAEGDLAWHLRHAVEVGEGASFGLIEHHVATGPHRHLDNSRLTLRIAADGEVRHARAQVGADGATSVLRTDAVLATAARYRRVDLELGAALSRHELNVRLEGDGASVAANGVLFAGGRRHVDTRLGIEHVARDTRSELLWRGIGAGRGKVVFHGGITIHAGADGSDANLSNKNLLLGEQAEVDTQPVLVIHADEVKAAHGATVGQLDANALFYLRSRGLPPADARRLLTAAFVREPLALLPEALRDALQDQLDIALRGLAP